MKKIVSIALFLMQASVTVSSANDSLNVRQVGFCDLGGERGRELDVVGNYAYVSAYQAGIRIVDVSNPSVPVVVGSFDPPVLAEPYGVAVSGNYAYVEDYYRGMRVVDISNPTSPFEVGSYQHYSDGRGIAVAGNYAYLAADYQGLKIVNISSPASPSLVGSFTTSGRSHYITVSGNYAYLSMFDPYSVAIIDISNPSAPVGIGSYPGTWVCMAVDGNHAYLTHGLNGLRVLDVSNPTSPTVVGNYDPAWGVGRITIAATFAYVSSDSGLRVLDISDFNSIHEVGFYYVSSMPYNNDIVVSGNYAYVACGGIPGFGELRIFDCSEATTSPCPPTSLPFIDNFDSPELDSCWTWIREDTSHWSLTERPGWMRIITQSGQDNWPSTPQCCLENKLLREVTDSDVRISCKLAFQPNAPFQQAGILVFKDEDNFIWGARSYGQDNAGQQCFIMAEQNGSSWDYHSLPVSDTLVYLRVDKTAETYAAYLSTDSVDWTYIGSVTSSLSANGVIKVGLYGATGPDSTVQNIPADFDYFRIDSIDTTTRALDLYSPGFVDCGTADSVRFTNAFSIDVFAKFNSSTDQLQTMAARDGYSANSKWIFAYNDESYPYTDNRLTLHACDRTQSPPCYWACSETWVPTTGRWYHLAIVVSNHFCTFYIDGQPFGSAPLPIDIPYISTPLTIGWAEGPGSYFNGELDNVRIWNRSLSQEEIQAIGGCTLDSAPGLLASYHFDTQNGNTVYDSGPYGYNGTLVGDATTLPSFRPDVPCEPPSTCGVVSGTWTNLYSPYEIACDVVVPDGQMLTIEPGVTIEFLGPYSINVEGTLRALGSAADSIRFTTDTLTNPDGWRGIRFLNAEPSSALDYCILEYGKVTGLVDSGYGGAVYCSASSPTFSNSTFRHNTARNGGGVNLNVNCNALISNCVFDDNDALERGGGLWIWDSAPVLTSCVFTGNTAITGGGAIRARQNVRLTIDSCTVTGNEGTSAGGGLFASAMCSLWVSNSIFDGNHAQQGGGWYSDTAFVAIDESSFESNTAQWGGAANINRSMTGSTVSSSRFVTNQSVAVGASGAGGAFSIFSQPILIEHCLFDGNTARLGGAIEVTNTHGYFDQCSFVNNSSDVSGAVGYSWQGHHHYNNGIFASNAGLAAFYLDGGTSTSSVLHSDWDAMPLNFANIAAPVGFQVLNAVNVNGDSVDTYGNLFMNPQFGVGEYDLQWSSPSIDAGDPASTLDIDGTNADQGWKPYYQPTLIVSSESLEFGTVLYGDSVGLEILVINLSPTSAPILEFTWSEAAFGASALPDWIAPGDSVSISVWFVPPMEGSYEDTLHIESKLAGPDVIDIPMSGFTPLVPSSVDSLVITRGALNGTMLYWAPVTTTTSGQPFTPTYYIVYGATSSDGPYVPFGVAITTSYHHPFIVNTQDKYFYIVEASDGSAVSAIRELVKELDARE
ncbi:MAG: DUF1349 domain-containing protein [Planctomycetes bacterium]|nr:DUF1349 domain-containing protein [Planctomycetota bacterium]